jgi:hypothetical protein
MSLTNCTLIDNHCGDGGNGAVVSCQGGPCTAPGGRAGSGGGIFNSGTLTILGGASIANTAGLSGQGPPSPGGSGGGICNQGSTSVESHTFDHNAAGNGLESFLGWPAADGGPGGAIYNASNFSATACTFSANSAGAGGNGIVFQDYSNARTYVSVGGNGGSGGAAANIGASSLTNCTFAGNNSGAGGSGATGPNFGAQGGNGGHGGGIYNAGGQPYAAKAGTCFLVACTLAGNRAGGGGPGGSNSSVYESPTASNGTNGDGGGIYNAGRCQNCAQPSAQLIDTLIAGNASEGAGPDLLGTFTSLGHNLVGQAGGPTGFTNGINSDLVGSTSRPISPRLAPLASNGGPTLTMALLHGSPALEAGDDALLGPPYNLTTDQRGFPRKSGGHMDIGALEFQFGGGSPVLNASQSPSGQFLFTFADSTRGATFTVLATTNLSLPPGGWTMLGAATQTAPGQFRFSDPQTTNKAWRFYRVTSP